METASKQFIGCLIWGIITTGLQALLLWAGTGLVDNLAIGAIISLFLLLYLGNVASLVGLIYINNKATSR